MNTENQQPETNVKATIDAITGLAKEVPIYPDAIQPAAKEIGKGLETVAKAVNIGLAPVAALVWGYEQIKDYLEKAISRKLENIPDDKIVAPPIEIAGPAIEALRFTENQPNLRDMFANLLASAMNSDTQRNVHPGFVEILKNLSGEECIILKEIKFNDSLANFDGMPYINILKKIYNKDGFHLDSYIVYDTLTPIELIKLDKINNDLVPSYLYNLERLGVLKIEVHSFIHPDRYSDLLNSDTVKLWTDSIERQNQINATSNNTLRLELGFSKGIIKVTPLGWGFLSTVIESI